MKRHGCPSHGIALAPDEKELWLADAHNGQLHIFDLTGAMVRQKQSIAMRDQPGWIMFSLDGRLVYPSTGEVIDTATKQIIATLQNENGAPVHSEKLLSLRSAGCSERTQPALNGPLRPGCPGEAWVAATSTEEPRNSTGRAHVERPGLAT